MTELKELKFCFLFSHLVSYHFSIWIYCVTAGMCGTVGLGTQAAPEASLDDSEQKGTYPRNTQVGNKQDILQQVNA